MQSGLWVCWLSHVAVVRFCVRHAYVRGTDGARLDALHQTFLEKFNAVPQWQNGGYEKPKFHPAEHLAAALDEFGATSGRPNWAPGSTKLHTDGSRKRDGLFGAAKRIPSCRVRAQGGRAT